MWTISCVRISSNGSETSTGLRSNDSNGTTAGCGSYLNPGGGARSRWTFNTQPVHASVSATASSLGHAPRISGVKLLVAQRFDRVETSRATRRPNAEEEPHSDAERRSQSDGLRRHKDFPACEPRQRSRSDRTKRDPQSAAQEAQSDGLDEELQENAESRRAECHADADLSRSLRDAD